VLLTWGRPPAPEHDPDAAPVVSSLPVEVPVADGPAEPGLGEAASVWADMSNAEHVSKAVADEHRRKSRAEVRRPTRKSDESTGLGE
jgi:hypothetical protein